jgi:hypothetical protein
MPPRRTALTALPRIAALISASAVALLSGSARAGAAHAAILPPANPQYSLGTGRYNPSTCTAVTDFSSACMRASLAMINAGRQAEGLGPAVLPANWRALTVSQQLFVLTELERGARGLQIDSGLSEGLDAAAVSGADAGRDPTGSGIAALWAGGEPNAIVVMADWIYEDGFFPDGSAENLNCTASTPSGCWQHRDILLHDGGSSPCGARCAVGAGYSPSGYGGASTAGTGSDSYAEVFAQHPSGAETFSWAAETAQLPPCEQNGDTCSWVGRPIATTSGIRTIGTVLPHAPRNSRPWFTTAVSSALGGRTLILHIHVGIRLRRVTVLAHQGSALVAMRVRRLSPRSYAATGKLGTGTWTVRIRYWLPRAGWRRPTSAMRVTI